MPIKVTAKGQVFTFPDGTPKETIKTALDKYFSKNALPGGREQVKAATKESRMESEYNRAMSRAVDATTEGAPAALLGFTEANIGPVVDEAAAGTSAAVQYAKGKLGYGPSGNSLKELYDLNLPIIRQNIDGAVEQAPGAYYGGMGVGLLNPANPVGKAIGATRAVPSAFGRAAARIGIGAGAGGAYGFAGGEGEEDRLAQAAVGAALGGGGTAAIEGIGRAARPLVRQLSSRLGGARGQAEELVNKAIASEGGSVKAAQGKMGQMSAAGVPATVADVSPSVVTLGKEAAKKSPKAEKILTDFFSAREAAQLKRLQTGLERPRPFPTLSDSMNAARDKIRNVYYKQADALPGTSHKIDAKSLYNTYSQQANKIAGDARVELLKALKTAKTLPKNPTWQNYKSIADSLDSQLSRYAKEGGKADVFAAIKPLKDTFQEAYRKSAPEAILKADRLTSATYKVEEAAKMGEKIVTDPRKFDLNTFVNMDKKAQNFAKMGAVDELLRQAGKAKAGSTAAKSASRDSFELMKRIFTPEEYKKVVSMFENELAATRTAQAFGAAPKGVMSVGPFESRPIGEAALLGDRGGMVFRALQALGDVRKSIPKPTAEKIAELITSGQLPQSAVRVPQTARIGILSGNFQQER